MILSHEEYLKLPVIALRGLEGSQPVDYTPLQIFLLPYIDALQTFWWIGFFAVIGFLSLRFLIVPLVTHRGGLTFPINITDPLAPRQPEGTAGDFWHRFQQAYRRLFSLQEIEQDIALRLYGGSILISFIVTYRAWQMHQGTTVDALNTNAVECWPFFQSCGDWLWLHTLPYGYSQTIFFMGMFGLVLLAGYSLIIRNIMRAHFCILILFAAKAYFTLVTFRYGGNFDYYHNLFCLVFLFLPYKRFFGSLMVILCYFLSTATKIHPSWTWGAYFTSMHGGLPLVPRGAEPLFTNLIIFMEMFMAWFIFSSRRWLQRSVFAFFVFFHLYSGTLVGFHYPTIVMPPLLIFFGTLFEPFPDVPLVKKSIPGWLLVATLLAVQLYSHTLPGDTKLTLQANHLGLYMFEANHQCRMTFLDEQGHVIEEKGGQGRIVNTRDSVDAHNRCDPWIILTAAQQSFCKVDPKPKIKFVMIHSINGGPFYEIVNEPDTCSLHYNAFTNNDWIKNETNAPKVGRPVENYYR